MQNSKITLLLFGLMTLIQEINAQELVKVKKCGTSPADREEFSVFVGDDSVRQGEYFRYVNSQLLIAGKYNNGEKSGIWTFYDRNQQIVHRVDFDTFHILEDNDSSMNKFEAIFLGGYDLFMDQVGQKIEYPKLAKRNSTTGIVVAKGTVDATGNLRDLEIIKAIGDGCDEALLSAIRLVDPFFFPKINQNGNREDSEVLIGVNFALM